MMATAFRMSRRSIAPLLMILVAMLAFKGLLHAQIGAETYADRVTALSNGTIIEQAGAWFMALWATGERPWPIWRSPSSLVRGLVLWSP